ncbi:MAG TPA: Fe-S cluster assembly protein SufD [Xanthomonadaceae bacterium]|jgi:Fe-S cluster assembly protein SufD|nr:Fe-S cluster assembly protein SufD [Xanthomonadaceae bacterium]
MSALLDSLADGFEGDAARRNALASALADGLPTKRAERWKYTSLRTLEQRTFAASATLLSPVDAAFIADMPAPRLTFVNGRFDASLSEIAALPDGIALQPLAQALAEGDTRETAFLGRRFDQADETFARLNAALALDGAVLRVAEGVQVNAPLHLVFIGTPADADIAWHARSLIELRIGACLTVVEHHLATGDHTHLGNALMHVHLAAGAQLRHARVQHEAVRATLIARTDAVLARDATYRRIDVELGAGLSRHELNVRLEGERARLQAHGVLLADGSRHIDTRLCIEHIARDTTCDLLWRGLASGRGRVVFHGGITIRAGADGSDARLSNKNLLLSAGAEIDAQPVLEIHADEVKAAHGATVGRLDETALFYLRSRGLPLADARALLVAAFCREPLRVLDDAALAAMLEAHVDAALARAEVA